MQQSVIKFVALAARTNCFHSSFSVFFPPQPVCLHACINYSPPPPLVSPDSYKVHNLRGYWGHLNVVQTLFKSRGVELQVLLLGHFGLFSSWLPKIALRLILKFMFLEYWYKGGGGGVEMNQTLVKVMFQCKEPTMAVLIPPPSTVL